MCYPHAVFHVHVSSDCVELPKNFDRNAVTPRKATMNIHFLVRVLGKCHPLLGKRKPATMHMHFPVRVLGNHHE